MKKPEFRKKYEQKGGSYQQEGVDKEEGKEGLGESRYAISFPFSPKTKISTEISGV